MPATLKSTALRRMVDVIETRLVQEVSKRLIAAYRGGHLTPDTARELGYIDRDPISGDTVPAPLLDSQRGVEDQDLMIHDWPSLQTLIMLSSVTTQALIRDVQQSVQRELRITPLMVGTMLVIKELAVADPTLSPWAVLNNPDKMRKVFGRLFFMRSRLMHLRNAEQLYSVYQTLGPQKYEHFPEF